MKDFLVAGDAVDLERFSDAFSLARAGAAGRPWAMPQRTCGRRPPECASRRIPGAFATCRGRVRRSPVFGNGRVHRFFPAAPPSAWCRTDGGADARRPVASCGESSGGNGSSGTPPGARGERFSGVFAFLVRRAVGCHTAKRTVRKIRTVLFKQGPRCRREATPLTIIGCRSPAKA